MNINQLNQPAVGVHIYPDGRMSVKSAAAYLGLAEGTLAKMRLEGTGPEFVRVGRKRIFYQQNALDAFIEAGRGVAAPQNRVRCAGGAE